jgi:Transcriptional regulators
MEMQRIISKFHIDKNIPVPLYYQFKQTLKELIQNGTLAVGEQIPTENEFCDALAISRPTVRQALKELINEGLLTRRKPLGTFVSQPKIDSYFFEQLASYDDEMKLLGLTPSTKVLVVNQTQVTGEIAYNLKINEADEVVYLKRLRFTDDDPMVVVETFLPSKLFPGLSKNDFNKLSLYETLETQYHCPVQSVHRTIEATLADDEIAKLLGIDKGSAICMTTTIAYNSNGIPIEFSIAKYRGDRSKFSLNLVKK